MAGTASLDGTKIEYTAAGKGRTTVVLIHGWTCDHTLWEAQIEGLKPYYRVLALDLPGHGASGAAPDYTMKRFARAVEAVLRAERVQRAVLVGHSMGGAVMLEFARLFPEKVAGIVAVDAMFADAQQAAAMPAFAARFQGPDAREHREKMVRSMFTEATPAAVREKIERVMLGAPAETAAGAMKGMADPAVWAEDVVDAPFLQIAAPTSGHITLERMKKRFPRAQLERVPGTGHFLHLEKPAEVNAILLGWLKAQKL